MRDLVPNWQFFPTSTEPDKTVCISSTECRKSHNIKIAIKYLENVAK